MIFLSNDDVAKVLDMSATVEALRAGYSDLERGDAAYSPRIDIYGPTSMADAYYRWGSMAGICRTYQTLAVRIKSDIVAWPEGGRREEKFAVSPGTYSGIILLFSQDNGEPLALIQDGLLQHMRVGGSAALGTERLARPNSHVLGILGAGGMARSHLSAMLEVMPIQSVLVYSPTAQHRQDVAHYAAERYGITATAADTAEAVVREADIVATTTNSMRATFRADWLRKGTHIVNVGIEEIGADVLERADVIAQLGHSTIPPKSNVPGVEYGVGAFASYITGSKNERARIPRPQDLGLHDYPVLFGYESNTGPKRTDDSQITLLFNTGTQGLQFASVAGLIYHRAVEQKLGTPMPREWFLENIRD